MIHHLALNASPWPFCGLGAEKEEFLSWASERDLEGDAYIVAMLGLVRPEIARYVTISKGKTRVLNDLSILHDDEDESALIILDSWGIANRIRRAAAGDLFSVHSTNGPRCGCPFKDPSYG